ncbi:hypothetical protein RI543_000974 [Arxiozyma heterogenica]|uniref:CAP-Gly domain-containing protein n=1 Tax=Arxiozyma heterogenica TaxID=278026 RepID=A0AAN7ZYU6_9SACH|nr:hypothetical protein RI543_000974 [Kazachstania heterogenica]
MQKLKVGDRILLEKDLCTIRYIGSIDQWPGITTFGVEWDDSTRGKHSGIYKGTQLFHTSVDGAGSFMKESTLISKLVQNKNIWNALDEVYGTPNVSDSDIHDIAFNNKHVECVGFGNLNNKNRDFAKLEVISLNRRAISRLGVNDSINTKKCLNVKSLDLGYNCFTNLATELSTFLESCPNLQELNLSGNRFLLEQEIPIIKPIKHVKRLYLTSCHVKKNLLSIIFKLFPNLEFLDLSLNGLNEGDFSNITIPITLKSLILNKNDLQTIPLSIFNSNIQDLDVSENMIEQDIPNNTGTLNKIQSLDITNNKLKAWSTLDKINVVFPFLKSIKLNNNPIVGVMEKVVSTQQDLDPMFYQIIARLQRIQYIDGFFVSKTIRELAESYFVLHSKEKKYSMDHKLERWQWLQSHFSKQTKLSVSCLDDDNDDETFLSNSLIQINIKNIQGLEEFKLHVLDTWTLRTLKGKVASLTFKNILSLKLFIMDNSDNRKQYLEKEFLKIKDNYLTSGSDVYYE